MVRAALQQITAFQASAAADRLAGQPALRGLLTAGPSQDSALRALLTGSSSLIQLPRTYIVVAGDDGRLVDTTMPAADPQPDSSLGSLRAAEGGHRAAGIELIGNRLPSYDVAVPVTAGDGHVVGAVAYLAPVTLQLQQLTGLI